MIKTTSRNPYTKGITIESVTVTTLENVLQILREQGGSTDVDWNGRHPSLLPTNRLGLCYVMTKIKDGRVIEIRPESGTRVGIWTTREEQIAILTALVDAGAQFNDQDQVLTLIGRGSGS